MIHSARAIWLTLCMIHFVLSIDFIVFPDRPSSIFICSEITSQLNNYLGPSRVETHTTEKLQMTWFWFIQATEEQKETIKKWRGVKDVVENAPMSNNNGRMLSNTSAEDRRLDSTRFSRGSNVTELGASKFQPHAAEDLALVSWPPDTSLPMTGGIEGYYYDSDGGTNTFIYVIDNGINMQNDEFLGMPGGQPEWHFPRTSILRIEKDDDKHGHGSCVASKAAGKLTGVSKNSKLVIMKSSNWIYDELSAFENVLDDIIKESRGGRSVVVYSRSSQDRYTTKFPLLSLPVAWQAIRMLMEAIVEQQVPVVVGAGNNNTRTSALDRVPATWLGQFPLVVVGAVTNTGKYATWTQGIVQGGNPNRETFWAPGEDVLCANGPSAPGLRYENGTSFSAGMVAGLIAYSLNLPQGPDRKSPWDIITWLSFTSRRISKRFRRASTTPKVIWNQQRRGTSSILNTSSSETSLLLPQQVRNGNLTAGPISLVNQTASTAYSLDDTKV